MGIDERKVKILQAIIDYYVDTAEPIGSRTIAKKYNLGISSATIRNEMADLEDMGYLEQPHSSSGRKPSNKGYRLYVDKLMQLSGLTQEEELFIRNKILSITLQEINTILKQVTGVLSDLTKLTCIVKSPSVQKSSIKYVQLVSIDKNSILLVIITDNGIIKNNVIRINKNVNQDVLIKLSNILNTRLKNLNCDQINLEVINNLKSDLKGYDDIFNAIIPVLYDSLSSTDKSEIYMEGTTNIFSYPEYNDIQRAREFLSLLDNKEKVSNLLDSGSGISVKIGNENYIEGAEDCSVVSTIYSINGKPVGEIGVIGPTRMHYSKIISVMANVVKELNSILNIIYPEDG
ncbi:heat-inducible transcriptional repressor HrcA [Clostridium fermenticellae]|uniref:Heat-inducible transcription repressor HrcA n=1 Tax=Clostridium fermenticellae TaxID=2068654 RepID=A0A386H5K1_9CLOT|nr:heat-inducible transcriptional repressor HrcA [Clostridium fermenticellae]AYD40989.1 heat-inducible transcriptional repressor HrcA [Clostridium fermenticellae]